MVMTPGLTMVMTPGRVQRTAVFWLVRVSLGGVLGALTTFFTYVVDIQRLVDGAAATALMYLAGTVAAALEAVYAGVAATRWLIGLRFKEER